MFIRIMMMPLVVLTVTTAAFAADSAVTFTEVFARPSAGKVGVAFFTATSTTNDSITSVSSDCCDAVEIHRTEKLNGVMSMRRIAQLKLNKKTATRIQPDSKGGEHMMLIGLKEPLSAGDTVSVTFTFAKAPAQTLTIPVTALTPHDGVHELH